MAIGPVVTRGYSIGSIALVVTRGYGKGLPRDAACISNVSVRQATLHGIEVRQAEVTGDVRQADLENIRVACK